MFGVSQRTRLPFLAIFGWPPEMLARSLIFLIAAGLGGCGGGSGQSSGGMTPGNPSGGAIPVNYDTSEYRENYGLDAINAIAAYNEGLSGDGITVGVIDTGIDVDHYDLENNIHPASTNIVTGSTADLDAMDPHGTYLAGVIAAERNGDSAHGVAFNARLLVVNATDPANCTDDDCTLYQNDIADGIDYARQNGARVINLSLGTDDAGLDAYLTSSIRRAVAGGLVIVISSGNEGQPEPDSLAQLATEDWANGQIIIAGAIDQNNLSADFSNTPSYLFQNVFLVAPGVRILTTTLDGGLAYVSGTSVAAPHIAGAVAILAERFPNLSPHDLAEILFTTATDLGDPGVDPEFGYGLVNLEAAIQPIGTTAVATAIDVTPAAPESENRVALSNMHLSRAFGDSLVQSSAINSAMFVDEYARSYRTDLGHNIKRQQTLPDIALLTEPGQRLARRDLHTAGGTSLYISALLRNGFAEIDQRYFSHQAPDHIRNRDMKFRLAHSMNENTQFMFSANTVLGPGHAHDLEELFLNQPGNDLPGIDSINDFALAFSHRLNDDTTLVFSAAYNRLSSPEQALEGYNSSVTMRLSQTVADRLTFYADVGAIDESDTVLGSLSGGALSLGTGATTTYGSLGATWKLAPSVSLFGSWTEGYTTVDPARESLIDHVSNLKTSSFRAGLTVMGLADISDRLGFMISQPLRVNSGTADLRRAASRDYSTDTLKFVSQTASLSPSAREIDLEMGYSLPLLANFTLQANFLYQINAGHSAAAGNATLALLRLSKNF